MWRAFLPNAAFDDFTCSAFESWHGRPVIVNSGYLHMAKHDKKHDLGIAAMATARKLRSSKIARKERKNPAKGALHESQSAQY
jgi:hypothetical protein